MFEQLEIKSKDEVGEMARDFNNMTRILKEIISKAALASEQVASAVNEVAQQIQEVSAAVQQINVGAQDMVSIIDDIAKSSEQMRRLSQASLPRLAVLLKHRIL
ncbi:MAG: methyl-accepting chemotaxis protein [Clostridia bacterium]|jgi:methyl-accepting chemotaxis protein|nr:methyl-accepting chemotaxis protein [Clostridia bacterium]